MQEREEAWWVIVIKLKVSVQISITEYYYHSRIHSEGRSLELVVPDHEEGVIVVHHGQVRGPVPLHGCRSPLNVTPAPHQGRHRPLHRLRLGSGAGLAGDSPPDGRLGVGDEGGVPGEGGGGEVGAGV